MKDIKLTDDLVFENGDLKLVDGADRVVQQIKVGLKILKGDWFLDYRKGIDYFNGMKKYENIMSAEIKKAIQEVVDVDSVKNYSFKKSIDKYNVVANVSINNRLYKISEVYTL